MGSPSGSVNQLLVLPNLVVSMKIVLVLPVLNLFWDYNNIMN